LYLAPILLLDLGVEFAMSKLRFSKTAIDEMALLLATNVHPREIARSFHCYFTTVYRIKQNVGLFREARPAPVSVISRP
jgi:DNA invertase Pin-like site-specific DNA recombinase